MLTESVCEKYTLEISIAIVSGNTNYVNNHLAEFYECERAVKVKLAKISQI